MNRGGRSLGRGRWDPFSDPYQFWQVFGCPCCGTKTEHDYNDIKTVEGQTIRTCPVQQARIRANTVKRLEVTVGTTSQITR